MTRRTVAVKRHEASPPALVSIKQGTDAEGELDPRVHPGPRPAGVGMSTCDPPPPPRGTCRGTTRDPGSQPHDVAVDFHDLRLEPFLDAFVDMLVDDLLANPPANPPRKGP